jgi:hypothetical protein
MQTMTPPSAGRVIFREGLIFGVLLGIAYIGLSVLNGLFVQSIVLGGVLMILLWLGVFFWVGARGAKQTGRVGTGSLAGLVTAVFAGAIAFIFLLIIEAPSVPAIRQQFIDAYKAQGVSVQITDSTVWIFLIVGGIILWLLGIGAGAGMGALGGLLGRSQSTVVPAPMYPPPPYGPPPMPPPYPPPYVPPYQNQPPQSSDQPPA